MKVEQIIQRVQSLYSKGVHSDDTRLTSRHIYSALSTARATILRQQANKNQKINDWNYQILPCIELQPAAIHECPCIPTNGCTILRSKHKLPRPITGLNNNLIKYVTSLDGSIRFDENSFENNKYMLGSKYTSTKPDFYFSNGYLFVTVLKNLKAIRASILADDFIEANAFPSFCGPCTDCECEDIMSLEFPLDANLILPVLDISNQELIILMKQITEDRPNNTTDDTSSAGKMVHQPQQQGE